MKRIRLVKIVVPDIVAYFRYGMGPTESESEYQCSCGMGVIKEYNYCPYCGAELAWDKIMQPTKEVRKLLERL